MADEEQLSWYQNLSIIRWVFAIFGILTMLFTGGCSLMVLFDFVTRGVDNYGFNSPLSILTFGGIPFAIGFLIWWLAAKVGRETKVQTGD